VHAGVLESITCRNLLELAAELLPDHPLEHGEIPRTELHLADEVFTCGTLAEVQPVLAIDDLPVGDGTAGRVTRLLPRRLPAALPERQQRPGLVAAV